MSLGRRLRVALLTEIISPYRVAPFNALADDPNIDLEVFFFAESEDRRSWHAPDASRFRFKHEVLPGAIVGRRYQSGALFLNPGIVSRLRRGRHDVVVAGGYHHPTIWLALLYCRLAGTRVLGWSESTGRDARSGSALVEWVKRRLVPRFDGFIAAGTPQRQYLEALGVPAERIWVAPDAVDVRWFDRAAGLRDTEGARVKRLLKTSGLVVLYVGRLIDQKGVPDLLEAAERVGGATFVLVGDGPDRAKYEERCRRLSNVRLVGFVQPSELVQYYAAADVFVYPTHTDPWGLAINEAMASGLPVIVSSAAGAAADLVCHGENGFVHDPGDVGALTQALGGLACDEALRSRMGARSRERIALFTPERMAEGMATAVQAVAARGRPARRSRERSDRAAS